MFCRHCGKEIEDTSKFCTFCGEKTEETEKLEIHEKSTEKIEKRKPTSSNKRLFNFFLDMIFYYIFAFLFGVIIGVLWGTDAISDDISSAFGLLATLIYFVLFESLFGKSVAKFITKTKVVNRNGSKPSFGTILLRSVCRFIPFDIFSFFGSNPVGWHDSLSKTMVVDDK